MYELLGLFGVSLSVSLALTPLCRLVARRCGLVDRPDTHRKLHTRMTPTAGGPAVLLATALALGLGLWWGGATWADLSWRILIGLFVGCFFICAVGLADDFGLLRGRHKLLGQLVAVALVISFGVRVDRIALFSWHIELGVAALPFTVFFLLGAINSLNLLDGMDGLLSTIGLILLLSLGAMALTSGRMTAAWMAFATAGALMGFLWYNLPPASIFLGDSGSMVIGLAVGVLAIQSSLKGPATVALAAPAALLILPIFDTSAAILRRKLTGRSVHCTDHGHLHHCLKRGGLGNYSVLLLVGGLGLLTTLGALGSVAFSNEWLALVSAVCVVGVLIVTRLFGWAELTLVLQRIRALGRSLTRGPAQRPREIQVRLLGCLDWKELWEALLAHCQELDLKEVRLDVNAPALNEGYHARWDVHHDSGEAAGLWRAEFPLVVHDRVIGSLEVAGGRDGSPISDKLNALSQLINEFEATAQRMTISAGTTVLVAAAPSPYALGDRDRRKAVRPRRTALMQESLPLHVDGRETA